MTWKNYMKIKANKVKHGDIASVMVMDEEMSWKNK
jgi:hypothetical protein